MYQLSKNKYVKQQIKIVFKWANLWAMAGDWNMSHLSNTSRTYKHIESSILDDIIKWKCPNIKIGNITYEIGTTF